MRPFNSSIMHFEWLRPRDGDHARCDMNDMRRGYNDVAGGALERSYPASPIDPERAHALRPIRLLDRDIGRGLASTLDVLLDVHQRLETGLDRIGGNVAQNIGCDGIAQAVEIVDQLAAARCQK